MKNLYQYIVTNKLLFSGIAILGVVLSHLIGVDNTTVLWFIFYPGFVGVDIFLFFSGYGLCRSLENNTLLQFYVRRMKRIYPMLVIFTIFLYIIAIGVQHTSFNIFDILCNLTTLSFWGVGGIPAEWYISFLIYLYLLFPLFYFVIRKYGYFVLIVEFICLFLFLYFNQEGWVYQCASSRIPIFTFGILCSQRKNEHVYRHGLILFTIAFVIMLGLFLIHRVQKFELVYMSAPLVLLGLASLCQRISKSQGFIIKIFEKLGTYSLEIYLSNMLILNIIPYSHSLMPVVCQYVLGHLVFVPMMIGLNHNCKKI